MTQHQQQQQYLLTIKNPMQEYNADLATSSTSSDNNKFNFHVSILEDGEIVEENSQDSVATIEELPHLEMAMKHSLVSSELEITKHMLKETRVELFSGLGIVRNLKDKVRMFSSKVEEQREDVLKSKDEMKSLVYELGKANLSLRQIILANKNIQRLLEKERKSHRSYVSEIRRKSLPIRSRSERIRKKNHCKKFLPMNNTHKKKFIFF